MAVVTGTTVKRNLKDPEVLKELVESDLEMSYIHAGLKYGKVASIDNTLEGTAGSSITVIAYNYIGEAVEVGEGEEIAVSQLTGVQAVSPVVKKSGKGTAITDEAVEIAYGDPAGELKKQISLAIQHKIDNDILDCLKTAPLVYDDLTNDVTKPKPIRYESVLNAVGKFEDEEIGNYAIFVHPNQRIDLLSDAAFEKVSEMTKDSFFFDGAIGKIADCDIILSRRVPTVKKGGSGQDAENIASYINFIVKPQAVKLLTKRNLLVETFRNAKRKQTEVYADAIYAVWLEFGDRVVKLLSPVGFGADIKLQLTY